MRSSNTNGKGFLGILLILAIVGILLVSVTLVSAAYPPATFTQDWPLQLVGASTVNVTQAQFLAMAAAHAASYTDNVGNVWDGVAMWRLVSLVDDIDPATFNSAAVNVCTVKETACDNYTSSWSGSILVSSTSSDNYAMVANKLNGSTLPTANPGGDKPWYPLRAVGSGIGGVGGGKTTGGLIKIELLNLRVTTVSVSPSSQAVANSASFTVDLAINTNQQSRGWQANVDFDATRMQCTGITEGGFLKDYALANGGSTIQGSTPTIDNVNGHVTNISYAIMGAGTGGPTSTGTLCTLAFTAKASIDSFASITPSGVVVSDQNATSIPGVVATGGQVAIGNVPMPDLVVSALSATKASDTTYTITYTIKNQGNDNATACSTSIVIDGGATTITVDCPALAAGVSDNHTTAAQTFTSPTDTIRVTADSTNTVAEGNEGNNAREIAYALAGDNGDVIINGNILAKLDLTVPANINNWVLQQGQNSTTGAANVKCNTPWQLQVNDQGGTNGHMTKWNGSYATPNVQLFTALRVGCESTVELSTANKLIADGIVTDQNLDAGQGLTITFSQQVLYSDPVLTGSYSYHIVVTFTASSTL